jgi:hypothetical protein
LCGFDRIRCYDEQIFSKFDRYEDLAGASDPTRTCLAILSTCRQINAEVALLPFALNIFPHHCHLKQEFYHGVSALQRAAIKIIKMKFGWIHVVAPTQCLTLDQDILDQDELKFVFIHLLPGMIIGEIQIIDTSQSTWNAKGRE